MQPRDAPSNAQTTQMFGNPPLSHVVYPWVSPARLRSPKPLRKKKKEERGGGRDEGEEHSDGAPSAGAAYWHTEPDAHSH